MLDAFFIFSTLHFVCRLLPLSLDTNPPSPFLFYSCHRLDPALSLGVNEFGMFFCFLFFPLG